MPRKRNASMCVRRFPNRPAVSVSETRLEAMVPHQPQVLRTGNAVDQGFRAQVDELPDGIGVDPVPVPVSCRSVAPEVDLVGHEASGCEPTTHPLVGQGKLPDMLQSGLREDHVYGPVEFVHRVAVSSGR